MLVQHSVDRGIITSVKCRHSRRYGLAYLTVPAHIIPFFETGGKMTILAVRQLKAKSADNLITHDNMDKEDIRYSLY